MRFEGIGCYIQVVAVLSGIGGELAVKGSEKASVNM